MALRSRLAAVFSRRVSRRAGAGMLLALVIVTSITAAVAANPARPSRAGASTSSVGAAPAASASLASVAALPDLSIAAVQNRRLPGSILDDHGLLLGGVGSDIWRSPSDPQGEFWMVTDRGPNGQLKEAGETRRTFPVPGFTPHILRVRVQDESVEVLDTVPIVGQSGQPVTGLPNTAGDEAPYDVTGHTPLPLNPSGLDVEGLIRTASGDFWAVEEYGPSLVHIDRNGTVLRRFVPAGLQIEGADYPIVASLPEILRLRAPNRGFEGLTLSPDGSTLYLALQGPLSNPDEKTANGSRVARVLAFDIADERVTAEYAYPLGWLNDKKVAKQQAAAAKPERAPKPGQAARADKAEKPSEPETVPTRISALAPVGSSGLLVLEQTSEDARLYLVDLAAAANLLGTDWDDPLTMPSLESMADPGAEGVSMLGRTLVADLSSIPGLPKKIEGIAILDATTVAIANDNDFGLGKLDQYGNNVGAGVKSQILTVTLPEPLPFPGDHAVSLRLPISPVVR